MTADEIRKWASKGHSEINALRVDCYPGEFARSIASWTLDTQMGQMLMLAEIAAQLAEANKLKLFELGLDEEKP